MAESKLDIWNAALDRIGENDAVEDENEDRIAAEVCRRHYDRCRREVLTALRWPFATTQAAIAELVGKSVVGWEHVYGLPANCLEPRVLLGEGQRWDLLDPDSRPPFDVHALVSQVEDPPGSGIYRDGVQQAFCCDLAPTDFDALEYTLDIEDVSKFSALFESALAWRLAAELALGVKRSRSEHDAIMLDSPVRPGDYPRALRLAATAAMRGTQKSPDPETPSMAARR